MTTVTAADLLAANFRLRHRRSKSMSARCQGVDPHRGDAGVVQWRSSQLRGSIENTTLPVGTPPAELTVAVSVMAEPGTAVAGATRADLVARAVTWRGMLSLLGKNAAFPL